MTATDTSQSGVSHTQTIAAAGDADGAGADAPAARWADWPTWKLALRAFEVVFLFVGLPVGYALIPDRPAMFAVLWAFTIPCFVWLLFRRGFDRRKLWNAKPLGRELPWILGRFLVFGGILLVAIWRYLPDELWLRLPREMPGLWGMIMLLYPWFSVYPQGIIARVFFFERYQPLFGAGRWMIVASAVAFSIMHIIFLRPEIAMSLTLVGGLMFAWTYWRTQSALCAMIEHALYGMLIFTSGLGWYFFAGAANAAANGAPG
jgi:membrane protease YdiL (CAAX protease family)